MPIPGTTGQERCSLLQMGFCHSLSSPMGQAHGVSRVETCGWSNSGEKYNRLPYVFTSLSFPHSDSIVQMKYIKRTLKSRTCAKMHPQECSVIEKNGSDLNVHVRE